MIEWSVSDNFAFDRGRLKAADPELRRLDDGMWYVLAHEPALKDRDFPMIRVDSVKDIVVAGPFEDLELAQSAYVLLYGGEG